jgi:hypothetical protein
MTIIDWLEEIRAHLGAALVQVIPSDDEVIVDHMRDALRCAERALELAQPPRDPVADRQAMAAALWAKAWAEARRQIDWRDVC